jgi:hypothetical protein
VVGHIINLISGTHNFCERKEYAFNILPKYLIITQRIKGLILLANARGSKQILLEKEHIPCGTPSIATNLAIGCTTFVDVP